MRRFVLIALLTSGVAGCTLTAYRVRPAMVVAAEPDDGDELVVVDTPPPAPQTELVVAAPFPGAVWTGGYWSWAGFHHTWVAGRWVQPRGGYVWRPYRWVHNGHRWHLRSGHWVRQHSGR